MRLRIVRPLPPELDGISLDHLRFGACYDLRPPIYELLLADGYGVPVDIIDAPQARATADDRSPKTKTKRRTTDR